MAGDLSNLAERVEWARANDAAARNISRNGRRFARRRLRPEAIYCYYYR